MRLAAIYARRTEGGGWRFELPTVPQAAYMLSFAEDDSEQPVWWLVSDAFTEVLRHALDPRSGPGHGSQGEGGQDPAGHSEQLIARGVVPNDLASIRATNRPLKTVEYGVVPDGFRQALPPAGPPLPLVPGRTYVLTVLGSTGAAIAQQAFTA